MENVDSVRVIEGGLHVDDRGALSSVNGFDFEGVKRFYMIRNHRPGFVRAWHAHRREAKYVFVAQGAALVGAVKIDNWDRPSKDLSVERVILSAERPAVLYIPAGFANGTMSLTEDANLIFFSTSALEESRDDDVRYDSRYWDIWNVDER
ncbi:MAG: dTDP-4-dehydrorhamnose 3,5-epimerase family protein [Nitrospinota bacterium]|jgi:dTDP-4-dehydrorhamnose 3,5-epimerase|nr:dTDP-4-dehydrorhamnose 3,5-epimerase family protein [Nitrospinota bacterium]